MKTKLGAGLKTLALILPLLLANATQAAKTENAALAITKYETRLQNISRRLEQADAPFQQMGPKSAEMVETSIDEVQMSLDDLSERLAMIRFVTDRDGVAPREKRELAQAELAFIETEISDLETDSSALLNEVDAVVWY